MFTKFLIREQPYSDLINFQAFKIAIYLRMAQNMREIETEEAGLKFNSLIFKDSVGTLILLSL